MCEHIELNATISRSGPTPGGIGFIYATEVADLAMVSAIGTAVRSATGATGLSWVELMTQAARKRKLLSPQIAQRGAE